MILVTAAHGHQGRQLVPKLAAAGFRVRAARVSPDRGDEILRLGATEVFVGDLSDPATYLRAVDGVDTVYHVGPGAVAREREMGFAMVNAARSRGVRHVVFSSVLHPTIDIVQHRYKRDIEERLIGSGLNYTILRPCEYMMPEVYIAPVLETGEYPVFWKLRSDLRRSLIDIGDLVDVAVKVISEGSRHYHASYDLAGPDRLTSQEIARILSRVTGREVAAIQRTPEDLLRVLFGTDQPTEALRHPFAVLRSIIRWNDEHDFIGNPNVLAWLLGRPPVSFEQFATAVHAVSSRAGPAPLRVG
jgi:uncharacterized protein YbjT (DUF2867 family)